MEVVLKEIIAREGQVVPVGQTIAIIDTEEVIKHPLGLDDLPDDYEHPEELEQVRHQIIPDRPPTDSIS
jgi:pyruvate/2-oxoglutarate dehydrogenase complex dihydrolipoamide acyltransferase (E2) component